MYEPINEYDLSAITNQVNEWKKYGKYANYDISRKSSGIAVIRLENIAAGDGSIMVFEIHKVAKKGFLKRKIGWIIQLYSMSSLDDIPEKKGCVRASTLVGTIVNAHLDVKHGFLSVADLDLSVRAFLG